MSKFLFLGYPPHKKGRKKFFQEIAQSQYPVIFYESPYRIIKSLSELSSVLDTGYKIQDTRIVVGRELTKKFETVYRGTLEEVLEKLQRDTLKGEFTVILSRLDKKRNFE
ncbi:MAG: S-adenosylmethionine-dependent methyltransferase [Parcubacteria group bacterium Greene1014_47]|nr:MAG: S-adenosylmethionine-dependent methyltransferase [Parcubacteria group bacterium Greene1014_47]